MKKGFTIIELLMAIMILATILIVVMALYRVAIREYPINFQRTKMQADANYAADAIAQNAKTGLAIPPTYDIYERTSSRLILETPAINSSGDFVYNGSQIEKDIYIYELIDGQLQKKIFGHPQGRNAGQNGTPQVILNHVTGFSCVYSYQVSGKADHYKTVQFNITTQTEVAGKTISFDIVKTANLRNAP